MTDFVTSLLKRIFGAEAKKVVKYGMVSVVSLVVTAITQFLGLHFFDLRVRYATLAAAIAGAIPSYYLNRQWVWGKSGKSHMRREVIPFWIMFFVGLGFATLCSGIADYFAKDLGGLAQSLITTSALVLAYGLLWIGKFILFNKVLFAHRPQDLDPVLDGRSGIPT